MLVLKSMLTMVDCHNLCQESYAGITETAYRTCDGFIIVFSITDLASFCAVNDFMEKIALLRELGHVPIILVGNKVDLANQRNVSQREAFEYAARKNIEYIETSAKTNHNVQQVFYKMAKAVVDMKHANTQPQIQQNKSRDDGCCCVL
uniref:Ras-related protein Ral-A n=1 Tax=Schistosoma haematobium TaxID=6185 RepID=A0A094ZPK5_SCHHA